MQQALDAAMAVRGTTSPNPWVGATLVRHGKVLSVGATAPPGGPHAEVAALAGLDARGATLYTTLEPCFPFDGKRTRPCSEVIVHAGVAKVVVALEDPDPNVRGRGIGHLMAAGIEVEVGDGHDEAVRGLRPYLKHRQTGIPYVVAKFAASLDGRIAANSGDSKWITGEIARDLSHRQRAWVDAIMVGSGTVLADNPSLTARPGGVLAERQPLRIVVDGRRRVPPDAAFLEAPGETLIATIPGAPVEWRAALAATGAQVLECEPADPGINLDQLLRVLGQRGILSLWAEGGAGLLGSLFDAHQVDEVWAFLAPRIIGGTGPAAVAGEGVALVTQATRLREVEVSRAADDLLVRGYAGSWEFSEP
jgi:diaminohydroxyphosphoribosylaminopyrimidine deaminase/5-amino-6-(5-phosphoribosylamino)uracil reductase